MRGQEDVKCLRGPLAHRRVERAGRHDSAVTAAGVYCAFAEFWDMRMIVRRAGLAADSESVEYRGRRYFFGRATDEERARLARVNAAEFRNHPARVLLGIKRGERLIVVRRFWSSDGQTQVGSPSQGFGLAWIQAGANRETTTTGEKK